MAGKNDDELLVFRDEVPAKPREPLGRPWKILIVDDEQEVHSITTLVLKDFTFEGRGVEFLHAYSSVQARRIMEANKGIAVLLLDVVMESDNAGLNLVEWVRLTLHDNLIRIILRTGQPGAAPEKQVITRFDINDYKEKTELTDTKLWTTIIVALRGYRDLSIITRSRAGLEKIVQASVMFTERQSLAHFFQGVLTQLTSLLHVDENSMMLHADGVALQGSQNGFRIISATGDFENLIGQPLEAIPDPMVLNVLYSGIKRQECFFESNYYFGYMSCDDGSENLIVLRAPGILEPEEQEIINVFSSNASIALLNVSLNKSIEESQSEMIFTLGEVIESRSIETGSHVKRVAAFGALLARRFGMEEKDVELLRFALPLHDIGKIGLPDSILNKPGELTEDQLLEMRKHTLIGYNLLRGGTHKTLQMASIIALTHHERWDGKGYPQGLSGEDIPLIGRITCVVDVFDALLNTRVYKPAWSLEEVIDYLKQNSATQFDPILVRCFIEALGEVQEIIKKFHE